jgi:hypothetical protein
MSKSNRPTSDQIKRELPEEMAQERASKRDELGWPRVNTPALRRNPGLCDPGRTFQNQDLDSIAELVGDMMADDNNVFSTTIHLEIKVHSNGEKADVRVLRQTGEWCVPSTFPASMLGQYLRAFWSATERLDDGGLVPMRIVCYQNGRFWEVPRFPGKHPEGLDH